VPSRIRSPEQSLNYNNEISIETWFNRNDAFLSLNASMECNAAPNITLTVKGFSRDKAYLVIALRPYNPEGISLIDDIKLNREGREWIVNGKRHFYLSEKPWRSILSNYRNGDVYAHIRQGSGKHTKQMQLHCGTGLATGAAVYMVDPGDEKNITVSIPYSGLEEKKCKALSNTHWADIISNAAQLTIPDPHYSFLYNAALRTLILLTPGDVFSGPYTYRRFWFRDAVFILYALLTLNLPDRVERVIGRFPERQRRDGYYLSQEGEWDSNGQVLWLLYQYFTAAGKPPCKEIIKSIRKAVQWIRKKRLSSSRNTIHAGLLPAGFSAEHFGPSDFYYWDGFWAEAGLRSASLLFERSGEERLAKLCIGEANELSSAIWRSIAQSVPYQQTGAIPSSPNRRMDAGAIGSIVCSYPLRLTAPDNEHVLAAAEYLYNNCLFEGAFFQDMIHSGCNPYLTLHLAQVLLRAGDRRFSKLVESVASSASPTGQWPEAIHPKTGGGCMGDGQHGWAAAEWVLMIRNMIIREESDRLIFFSGTPSEWIQEGSILKFGPIRTLFGIVLIEVECKKNKMDFMLTADWHNEQPGIEVVLPSGRKQKPNFRLREKGSMVCEIRL